MSAHRRVVVVVLAAALAAPGSAAAAASKPKLTYRSFRVTAVTGSERLDFTGDPAADCGDRGVCGITGTETFTPDPPGASAVAVLISYGGTSLGSIDLAGATTASVTTAGADAACTDTLEIDHATAAIGVGRAGWFAQLHGALPLPGLSIDDAVFATHCAGPRTADLAAARVLPRTMFRRRDLARRTLTLDLASHKAFTAAGFAAHVTADVRVTLRRIKNPGAGLGVSGTDVLPTPVR